MPTREQLNNNMAVDFLILRPKTDLAKKRYKGHNGPKIGTIKLDTDKNLKITIPQKKTRKNT